MVPRLVPEILSKCAFCDEAVGAGIGDSRSLILALFFFNEFKDQDLGTYRRRAPRTVIQGFSTN